MQHLRIPTLLVFGIIALGGVETAWADVVYSFTIIDVPGATSTVAFGTNDSGQIAGYYQDAGAGNHGFLATPTVPEPSTLPLLAGCLIGLAVVLRRRSAPVLRK